MNRLSVNPLGDTYLAVTSAGPGELASGAFGRRGRVGKKTPGVGEQQLGTNSQPAALSHTNADNVWASMILQKNSQVFGWIN